MCRKENSGGKGQKPEKYDVVRRGVLSFFSCYFIL